MQVRVWSDPWIPGIPNYTPGVPAPVVNTSLQVSALITDHLTWNEVKVRDLFSIEEAEAILRIPLSSKMVDDRCVWRMERNGSFLVKTAYRHSFVNSPSRKPSTLNVLGDFWKKVWKGVIPGTAKLHIWRVCNDILPSLERLASKYVVLESQLCVLCTVEVESTLHLCRHCSYTKSVLQTNSRVLQVALAIQIDGLDMVGWLSHCANHLQKGDFEDLMYMLWSVWKERNLRVWEQKHSNASDVALRASTRLAEFRLHSGKFGVTGSHSRVAKWSHPPTGMLKVNLDGSFLAASRTGGLGFVIRDSVGVMLAGGACPLRHLLSAEHAEALACQAAVQFVLQHNMMPAIFETDSMLVQRQVSGYGSLNTSVLGRIYDDIGEMLASTPNVRISYTKRGANTVAHLLADYAKSLQQETFFFSSPIFLQAALAADSTFV